MRCQDHSRLKKFRMDKSLRSDPKAFAALPETTGNLAVARPMNGADYLESLRDGREVFIYGERVEDVTTHPAFRNTARMTARLYDALHDPAHQKNLTLPTDTGNGSFTTRISRLRRLRTICSPAATPSRNGHVSPTDGLVVHRTTRHRFWPRAPIRTSMPLTGQCPPLVQIQSGAGSIRQSRHHSSACRSGQAAE